MRVLRVLRRAAADLAWRLPPDPRARCLRLLAVRPLASTRRGRAHWDEFYAGSYDPFQFDSSAVERQKFERTLELCGSGPYRSALEVGCSVGSFTEMLAPRCQSLLAIDVSSSAVERAARRLSAFTGVRVEARDATIDWPVGEFDLIVASDVLYYWTPSEILDVLRRIEASLSPGGVFVAMHFVRRVRDALLLGDEVHDLLTTSTRLDRLESSREEYGVGRSYRFDTFQRSV